VSRGRTSYSDRIPRERVDILIRTLIVRPRAYNGTSAW
jgi:hypothetical protein